MAMTCVNALLVAENAAAQSTQTACTLAPTNDSASSDIVSGDGVVHLPVTTLPFSSFASPEAKRALVELAAHPYPEPSGPIDVPGQAVDEWRRAFDREYFLPALKRFRERYPAIIESKIIGGVYADIVTPVDGISLQNKDRILINLHGGGFVLGARTNGQLESVPIASAGKIKVVTVDYRQGPEHRFPAASEDVASVYRELLNDYLPENIGIFGCSAGGLLTAQAVAWFQETKLPRPGAIAILCASAGRLDQGDSANLWSRGEDSSHVAYFKGANPHSPVFSPVDFPEVLAKFPPTLIMTSTRAGDLSSAVYTDIQLTKAGAMSELHVWDGLGHGGFINNADVPETKDAVNFIVNFFSRYLGRPTEKQEHARVTTTQP